MTPLGPSGQNGGAGLVATSLVCHLSRLVPDQQLILLTTQDNDAELAQLDAPNVRRVCVRSSGERGAQRAARRILGVLPPGLKAAARFRLSRLRHARRDAHVVDELAPDLIVCPFTVPTFARAGVPMLAIVYDLQHVAYPEFFTDDQRRARENHLRQACALADRVVCISDHVRNTLLEHLPWVGERAVTVHLGVLHDFPSTPRSSSDAFGLQTETYLLYPANFWPHKNHRTLFEALRGSSIRLVCTGAPNAMMDELRLEATALLGPDRVVFAGYVAPSTLRALLQNCRALIFPSLYEGFGMPVLEAMALTRPVLCSNIPSLVEVSGDAALLFDPRDPSAIGHALDRLDTTPTLEAELVRRGRARAAQFGDGRVMACKYQALFDKVLA